jgi:hypothetical protein
MDGEVEDESRDSRFHPSSGCIIDTHLYTWCTERKSERLDQLETAVVPENKSKEKARHKIKSTVTLHQMHFLIYCELKRS